MKNGLNPVSKYTAWTSRSFFAANPTLAHGKLSAPAPRQTMSRNGLYRKNSIGKLDNPSPHPRTATSSGELVDEYLKDKARVRQKAPDLLCYFVDGIGCGNRSSIVRDAQEALGLGGLLHGENS
jgi:hypothetical protein